MKQWRITHGNRLVFLIHVSIIWIYVMSLVHLSDQMARWLTWHGKNFNVGHYTQTFQPNFFTPAIHIGNIDFYHFIPLSLTLTLCGGHKVNTVQNLLASFSHTLFSWSWWNFMWHWSSSSWTIRYRFGERWNKGNNFSFTGCINKF